MGSDNSLNKEYSNCIRYGKMEGRLKEFELYGSYGEIINYLKQEDNYPIVNIKVFDANRREIGLIKEENKGQINYTFYNENNQVTKYIERSINDCFECCSCLTKYTFYDYNRNIEGFVSFINKGCDFIIEETDKYNTRISFAKGISSSCCDGYIGEFDNEGNIRYKILNYYDNEDMIKIFDSTEMEINFGNRSLINGGFTKIQLIIILNKIFYIHRGE